jgi:hypothetical protein
MSVVEKCRTSLDTFTLLRKSLPNTFLFFEQTYDDTVVVYDRDDAQKVRLWYLTMRDGTISRCSPLPTSLAQHMELKKRTKTDAMVMLPFLVDESVWTVRPSGRLQNGSHVLVSVVGHVDSATKTIPYVHLVFVDIETRTVESRRVECTDAANCLLSDMRGVVWSSLKELVGM